jgi:hypothetical protein
MMDRPVAMCCGVMFWHNAVTRFARNDEMFADNNCEATTSGEAVIIGKANIIEKALAFASAFFMRKRD